MWERRGGGGREAVACADVTGLELELVGESAAGFYLEVSHGSLVHCLLHLHLAQCLCSLNNLPGNSKMK